MKPSRVSAVADHSDGEATNFLTVSGSSKLLKGIEVTTSLYDIKTDDISDRLLKSISVWYGFCQIKKEDENVRIYKCYSNSNDK